MTRRLNDATPDEWDQANRQILNSVPEDWEKTVDMVNQPPHYKQGDIECIDAIRAALTPEEFRGYCKGNALKYVWRERYKGGTESIGKAEYYLHKMQE